MIPGLIVVTRGILLGALLLASVAFAQEKDLDTPYVQTPRNVVDKMLEVAKIGPGDFVIDLGSGDGRMVITAATRYGAQGFGVELERRLVELANRNAASAGVAARAKFYERDLFDTDISPATVLTLYLLPDVNLAIRSRVLTTLKPGTRVVSHDYDFGDWPPDLELEMPAPGKTVGAKQVSKVLYWVVPAVAAGKWRWVSPVAGKAAVHELTLDQNYQRLSGTLIVDGRPARMESVLLKGSAVNLVAAVDGAGRYEFSGRITGHEIAGTVKQVANDRATAFGGEQPWNAARIQLRDPRHLVQGAVVPVR